MDFGALLIGILFMGLAEYAPWPIDNRPVAFAFGMGLAAVPLLRVFMRIISKDTSDDE